MNKRSPTAPTQPLPVAIERTRLLHQRAHENWMPLEVMAQAWRLSGKSSSFLQAVATQGQFGLLLEQGSRENREFKLTDDALDIMTYPNTSSEWLKAVRACATSPPLHAEVLARFNGVLPPDDGMVRVYLLRQREGLKFHQDQVDGFIRQLRDTLEFAKLPDSDTINKAEDESPPPPPPPPQSIVVGNYVQWTSGGTDQFKPPRRVVWVSSDGQYARVEGSNTGIPVNELLQQPPPPKSPLDFTFVEDGHGGDEDEGQSKLVKVEYRLDEGKVVLLWPDELSKESFDEFEYWITGLLNRARRKAGIKPKEKSKIAGDEE